MDILTLRLNTHNPVVDYFVIAESHQTHMGNPRKLSFDPSDPRIQPFSHKIRYVLVTDFPGVDPWQNDPWQRDAIRRALWDARDEDLVLISDCDEIIKPHLIKHAQNHVGYDLFGFQQPIYFCYMNNRNIEGSPNQIWSVGVRHKKLRHHSPTDYRLGIRGIQFPRIWAYGDAGWHYSYMMTRDRIIDKIKNFAHQEYNNTEVFSQLDPEKSAREGKDLLGREWMRWELKPLEDLELPEFVSQNWDTYQKYFLL